MKLEVVNILPTIKTPAVLLDPKGTVKISGRAIDESRSDFSGQIIDWIDAYLLNPAKKTTVVLALEYLNSFNSIILVDLLRKFMVLRENSYAFEIQWYIEEGDDDLLERAQYISSSLDSYIEYIMTEDIKNNFLPE